MRYWLLCICMRGCRGGGSRGYIPSPENHKNIGLISNTCPDPLKILKATKPAFNIGHHWHTSLKPSKWRSAGGPMMARL